MRKSDMVNILQSEIPVDIGDTIYIIGRYTGEHSSREFQVIPETVIGITMYATSNYRDVENAAFWTVKIVNTIELIDGLKTNRFSKYDFKNYRVFTDIDEALEYLDNLDSLVKHTER